MLHFTHHADKQYEYALNSLLDTLLIMGNKTRELMDLAHGALKSLADQATAAKALDKEVNALEASVEQQVTALLTRHTMLVDELRFALSAIRIAAALERVGDMAKNTSKRIHKLPNSMPVELRDSYTAMIERTRFILAQALGLLEHYNEETALEVLKSDDEVDERYKQIIVAAQRDFGGEKIAPYLFLAKNLERMADYASSIAKEAAYIHTGKKLVLN